ncbi:MAG: hypothetical protein RMJ19_11495, partial [Gemmatales bacterium]|nr:hypothetical protein [Gemmatales bacterium]MDW8176289.1 hypothetical protein [Gemmatales bacterium]
WGISHAATGAGSVGASDRGGYAAPRPVTSAGRVSEALVPPVPRQGSDRQRYRLGGFFGLGRASGLRVKSGAWLS